MLLLKYLKKSIRSSVVLTNSYVAATVLGPQGVAPEADPVANNKLVLFIDFTIGSLTDARVKVEFSDDGTTYYQETNAGSPSSGVSTLTVNEYEMEATGKFTVVLDYTARYIKVSAKGTGTVTGSLMAIDAVLAVKP